MEKRSLLSYVGMFLFMILGVMGFSQGTLMTALFIEVYSPTSLTEFGISSLGAGVFIVSFILGRFTHPVPVIDLQTRIRDSSFSVIIISYVWMILLVGLLLFSSIALLTNDVPINPLFSIVLGYGFSGNIFALVFYRISAMKKI